ncbi:trypsin-like serine peptidase [Pseudonocardia parietis]|uniref:V8-like Glu-specific endopeptidase n=1 Tax=Pseudonocardia parietis TaxID=570936 RepID=A0ABS4W5U7_9PSEU|nr:trypsin-like peptidase domain-containing protein [Pseudonocardia parietis]MBP2371584.1 hypothetical protein [Pseudonocardia parietis]
MRIRRWSTVSVAAVMTVALTIVLWSSGAPQGGRVVGLGSVVPWGSADPRSPMAQPPVRGQAGPVVGGLSASSVGVLVVDGGRHQCSASVVASQSRRLLATAAHCVWLDGGWRVDGATFIPGYAAGEEPYGRWAVDTAYVAPAWTEANSPIEDVAADVDLAFVSVLPRDGVLPEQVLGAQGISFSTPPQVEVAALGYPALGSYDGQSLRGCVGTGAVEAFTRPESPQPGEIRSLDCDMTQGASGGPWLAGPEADSGRGQVVGVVSGGDDTHLVSPRFGPAAKRIYDAADTAALATTAPRPDTDPMSAQIAPRGGS